MAKKTNAVDESLFDSRVVERHIAAGLVDRVAYEAWLAGLEDVAADGEETETDMLATSGITDKMDLSADERR